MQFSVLGFLSVCGAGGLRLPSAPKTRQLLALLLLNSNRPVGFGTCMEELWATEVPRSAVQSLHTRVLHIRRTLAASPSVGSAEAAKSILVTQHHAYMFQQPRDSTLDLDVVKARAAEARRAQEAGDDRRTRDELRAALALWRGPVLSDVPLGPNLQARVTELEEFRLTLSEQCVEAELRLGMHHDLLSELGGLVAQHPLHENLHAQYMIALYRSRRLAQALEVYQGLRRTLNTELGVEPSLQMRGLQTAILSADPALAVPAPNGRKLLLDRFSTR